MSMRNSGPVPNRWMHCPRKAGEFIVNFFLAFKTPLGSHFDHAVPPECRFPPKMLFDFSKNKRFKFGLWIDLTNTHRFYDKEEVEEEDCKYIKLQCRGHGETPSRDQTQAFVRLVHNFITQHPLERIAVHCTHGFNRTGFLIVAYLVEQMDFSLEVALDTFARARPPGIYKEDYLRELYRRYEDLEDVPPPPELPSWCFEDGEAHVNNDSASTSKVSSGRNSKAMFMDGVPGVQHFTEQPKAFHLQRKVQTMCDWKKKGFPGCQPVSMDKDNICLLSQRPYRVSWKADGMRYMMLIDGFNEVYFFDRDHNIFKVQGLTFPRRKDMKKHLRDTLLDGEMVIDKVNGENIPRYLAYDIVKFEGQDVGKTPFYPTRLHCIEHEIIRPRHVAMESGQINKTSEPFSVRKKDFWEVTQAANLLGEKFARTLSHEPDGLIFQPSKESYTPGRCDLVLKWKPSDLNSIDFRLKIMKEEGEGIVTRKIGCLFVCQLDQPFAKMKYTAALKDYDNKIIECKLENQQWKFMRERTDKSFPNSLNTAKAVLGSIMHPITKEKLLDYINRYRFDDDADMMPPPAKRR